MKNTTTILFFVTALFFISCKKTIKKEDIILNKEAEATLNIKLSDNQNFTEAHTFLEMDSYVLLSKDVLINKVERAIYYDDNLYVFDNKDRIICYNKDGSINFKIDAKGRGPEEYDKIIDFSIDKVNKRIKLFTPIKIMNYSLKDGRYISMDEIKFIPRNIASIEGQNYFYNPSDSKYSENPEAYFYNLMWAKSKTDIAKRYLPHDPEFSSLRISLGNPFFYNGQDLFFINQFDEIIYSLKKEGSVTPKYQIKLPNAVPLSKVKETSDLFDLLDSDYSVGITDVFKCKNVLYFMFSKNGFYRFTFYNLKEQKTTFCGKIVAPNPTKELPVFYPFDGCTGDIFFSFVNPTAIVEGVKKNPNVFPSDLQKVKETDNPVLVFYNIKD